jgi:selenocysteine lyase/cysteine desulfurase
VTKQKTLYLNNNEEREEGGTPAIIESIRLGLVFKLKDSLSHDVVMAQEHKFAR